MKKVIISKINQYDYILKDKDNRVYMKNIDFKAKYQPKVGDIIYLDEKILDEVNIYTFKDIVDKDKVNIDDIIKVKNKEKAYYFERVYG